MCDHVIFAIEECRGRIRIGAFPASASPLPEGAEIIARVASEDLGMMILWAKRRAKRGWSVEKIRAACE
jgi:hypothetical protein